MLAALRELETRTQLANGLVLRLGQLYGPGTMSAPNGSVVCQTQLRGAYNMRARYTLDWRPQHVSWRQGFAAELARTAHHY